MRRTGCRRRHRGVGRHQRMVEYAAPPLTATKHSRGGAAGRNQCNVAPDGGDLIRRPRCSPHRKGRVFAQIRKMTHTEHANSERWNDLSGHVGRCAFKALLNGLGFGLRKQIYDNPHQLEVRSTRPSFCLRLNSDKPRAKPNTRRTAQDPRRIICVHQRASPSFICGKILPSRCCQPTRTKVLASLHAPDVPSVPTLEPSSDQPVKTPAQRHQRGIAMPEIVRVSDTPRCRSGSKRCCSVSCRAATCCGGCRHSKVRRRRRKCTGTRNSKAPRRHHHLATGRNFLAHATSSSRSPSRRT